MNHGTASSPLGKKLPVICSFLQGCTAMPSLCKILMCKILIEANRVSPHGMLADNCGLKLVIRS